MCKINMKYKIINWTFKVPNFSPFKIFNFRYWTLPFAAFSFDLYSILSCFYWNIKLSPANQNINLMIPPGPKKQTKGGQRRASLYFQPLLVSAELPVQPQQALPIRWEGPAAAVRSLRRKTQNNALSSLVEMMYLPSTQPLSFSAACLGEAVCNAATEWHHISDTLIAAKCKSLQSLSAGFRTTPTQC